MKCMTVSSAAIVPPMRREPVFQHLHCLCHLHGHRCHSPWSKSPLQDEPSSATAAHLLLFKPRTQRMAVWSAFTCAVIQALNRNGGNCNRGMGLIWNSFRKEERSSKANCPWICSPGCLTGPDCSLASSSSALFSLINCLFPGSHSWPQCCHRQSGAPGLPCALQPSLLLAVLAPLSLYMSWKDLCPEPQWRGQQCQKADACSPGEWPLLHMDRKLWLCFAPKTHLCDDALSLVLKVLQETPGSAHHCRVWGRTFPEDVVIPDIHMGHKAAVKS